MFSILNDTYFLIPNWKWLALLFGAIGGLLFVSIARTVLHSIFEKYSSKDKLPLFVKYLLQEKIHTPISWLLALGGWHFLLETLNLNESVAKFAVLVLHLFAIYQILKFSYMAVEAAGNAFTDFAKTTESTLDDQLAPFATKVLKIVVIGFGILLSLQSLGFNVGAVLAGLGIGSLALALAAQDTAANLFGSITIILDQPFQRGDYIKVADVEGTVEEVGFRSTRIRTFYKSIVTIPNATMAKEKIDNMGARPVRRLRHILGITYDTKPEKIQEFIEQIRYILVQNSIILKDDITIAFHEMGDFNLKILVNCFAQVNDINAELKVQQEILLQIMKIAKDINVEFAFPTQTLHVATLPFK